jgi:hypothetical protein
VDAVPRKAVFDDNNSERHDFTDLFRMENEGAEVKIVRWLSGARSCGSMVVYQAKERDAQFLLNRKIVHIRGEAAFAEVFYRRERPLRCQTARNMDTRKLDAPTRQAAGNALRLI